MVTIPCSACALVLPLDKFHAAPRNTGRHGRGSECKSCALAAARRRRRADPEAARARVRKWRLMNKERTRASDRVGNLRRYGLTLGDYDGMLADQDGTCALCASPPAPGSVLCVDHDHTTGRVRGLLCQPCNTSIGRFGDDPKRLREAADYVDLRNTNV